MASNLPDGAPDSNPPKVRDVIGEVLREERSSQDRTLADVAGEAAVSVQYLSEIERGRKEVSSDLLEAVCHSLEVEVAEVLERAAQHLRVRSDRGSRQAFMLVA